MLECQVGGGVSQKHNVVKPHTNETTAVNDLANACLSKVTLWTLTTMAVYLHVRHYVSLQSTVLLLLQQHEHARHQARLQERLRVHEKRRPKLHAKLQEQSSSIKHSWISIMQFKHLILQWILQWTQKISIVLLRTSRRSCKRLVLQNSQTRHSLQMMSRLVLSKEDCLGQEEVWETS